MDISRLPLTAPFRFHAVAFGCHWQSELPLSAFSTIADPGTPVDITVRSRPGPAPDRPSVISVHRMHHAHDGFRFLSEQLAADTYGLDTIDVHPGPDWPGRLPATFYGTVTAALMTWRGGLAIHASAVEVDGGAILLCGDSGSGKSTLAASLVAAGGRLISDDLSVLHPRTAREPTVLYAGRRGLRLFPDVAEMLGSCAAVETLVEQDDVKRVVVPPRVDLWTAIPLRCVLVLGETSQPATTEQGFKLVLRHRYRPLSFRNIPGHPGRMLQLASVCSQTPVVVLPRVEARNIDAFRGVGRRALEQIAKQTSDSKRPG